jgi:hypothetical protein
MPAGNGRALMAVTQLAAIACMTALATVAPRMRAQAEPASQVLSQVTLDIDHDGTLDRAVLSAPAGTASPSAGNSYMIGPDARIDLSIYWGAGRETQGRRRNPAFIKKDIVAGAHSNQIFPLATHDGSLVVRSAYNLFSNWAPETLIIVYRNGGFFVAGFARSYDLKNGDQGGCDIDFITGKGVASKDGGKARLITKKFKLLRLADWPPATLPKACGR